MHTAASSEVRPIRVLIVESSAVFRHLLVSELARDRQLHVIGHAPDPRAAWELIERHEPQVLLLDAQATAALAFLRQLMQQRPTPVIAMGSVTAEGSRSALDALEAGAAQWLSKPGPAMPLDELVPKLIEEIKSAGGVCAHKLIAPRPGKSAPMPVAPVDASRTVLALGASVGGMQALTEVLTHLPANAPGALVVQHMPPPLTALFADRLRGQCAVEVREAVDGDCLLSGRVLLAPGGSHMLLRRSDQGYHVEIKDGPELLHHKPSIDVLFHSVARCAGTGAVGAILTGTGTDGAAGLMHLRQAGHHTIAQDAQSSAAFDLPAAAIRRGAAEKIVALHEMAPMLMQLASVSGCDSYTSCDHGSD